MAFTIHSCREQSACEWMDVFVLMCWNPVVPSQLRTGTQWAWGWGWGARSSSSTEGVSNEAQPATGGATGERHVEVEVICNQPHIGLVNLCEEEHGKANLGVPWELAVGRQVSYGRVRALWAKGSLD